MAVPGEEVKPGLLNHKLAQSQLIIRVHENRIDAETGLMNPPHGRKGDGKRRMVSGKVEMKLEMVPDHDRLQAEPGPPGDGQVQDPTVPDQSAVFGT